MVALGHNLAPGRAPVGGGVLTGFFMTNWSLERWHDDDDKIVALTRDTIDRHFPGWADSVETSLVTRWDPALVASRPGTYRDLAAFHRACDPNDPIQLAGDYLARSSVNATVRAGEPHIGAPDRGFPRLLGKRRLQQRAADQRMSSTASSRDSPATSVEPRQRFDPGRASYGDARAGGPRPSTSRLGAARVLPRST